MLRKLARTTKTAFKDFISHEASGGYVLMAAAALALVVANSPLAESYFHVLHAPIGPMGVQHWINDGLMALFFLLVGLEIKREVLDGQLSRLADVLLPGAAALGGVALPALIYLALNRTHVESIAGWAIPSATDIAFALGVLALVGSRVPTSLKVFLTAIAIMDDLAAIVIIALFYTAQLHLLYLAGAGLVLLVLIALNRLKVMALWAYLLLGAVLWFLVLKSGIHATLAGVALALTIPLRGGDHSPLHRLEHALHKPVAFMVTPIFGFANAGLSFAGVGLAALLDPVPLGVALGLFVGKQLGVFGVAFSLIKLGWARLPRGASFGQLYGVAVLCGVGFTMSLFIGALAFKDPHLIVETKIGVLAGSLASALVGMAILRAAKPGAEA
ncbi:Na+/H+ antiporter NhaA [Caulobacter segnis]|uniref:Na(+)/H(+) antiporter NhaA n=1 Tax=Caulobacter segnis TaxID=88688 RepID=A0A2W5V2J1_9CAUL|nr:Na+/H+ antiporter NhaA [Caulobacter segnis]PZR30916.1 MAG: Na+/H+ antiporter NhaA [Caulobacter segnis]